MTEPEAYESLVLRALDLAHLTADHGTTHPYYEKWKADYLAARQAWRELAFITAPVGATA